jgi:hypothetical protein
MRLRIHSGTLLGGLTAGALLLAGTSACSRDRTSGTDSQTQTGAATSADTQQRTVQPDTARPTSTDTAIGLAMAPGTKRPAGVKDSAETRHPVTHTRDTGVSGYRAMGQDTSFVDTTNHPSQVAPSDTTQASPDAAVQPNQAGATDSTQPSQDTVVVGDSSNVGKTGNRLEPTQSSEQGNADTLANQPGSDRVRPPEDSTETVGVTSGMARDTTTALAQADTAAPAPSDSAPPVTVQADTAPAHSDTSSQMAADTSAIQVQVDTQQTEVAQQAPSDTTAVQAQVDTSTQAQVDTVGQQTEMAQRAPVDSAQAQAQADTTTIAATDSAEVIAQQPTQAVETDAAEVGAADVSTANMATGAEAVALVSREGRRCTVVDAEEDKDARWDLASSPATMNPCGTGTMTLTRVQSEK